MQLEQGLWAYDHKSNKFGRLDYLDKNNGWSFMPLHSMFGFIEGHSEIDWPNLEIFTMREVK